jgi:hypothetical protein
MRRLTRPEIESGGRAMPRIMNFHDQLIGSKLFRVTRRRSDWRQPPPLLILENGVTLATQYDDEGNPGDTEWQVTDREGYMYRPVQVQDLCNQPVTAVGYFLDPLNGPRKVIPYVEFSELFCVCCMTPHGGGVIHHHRPGNDSWDLFCQFTPQLETKPQESP